MDMPQFDKLVGDTKSHFIADVHRIKERLSVPTQLREADDNELQKLVMAAYACSRQKDGPDALSHLMIFVMDLAKELQDSIYYVLTTFTEHEMERLIIELYWLDDQTFLSAGFWGSDMPTTIVTTCPEDYLMQLLRDLVAGWLLRQHGIELVRACH